MDQVKDVMMKNIENVTTRGDRLEDLGERAEMLTMNADMFQRSAARVRKGGMAFGSRYCPSPPPPPPALDVETAEVSET